MVSGTAVSVYAALMRILLGVPSLDPAFGGPTEKAFRLATALREAGHGVSIVGVGANRHGAVGLREAGRFHGTPFPLDFTPLIAAVRRADLVHVFGQRDPIGTASILAARCYQKPYVLEPCGMHRRRLRSMRLKALFDTTLGRTIVEWAEMVVATSRLEAWELAHDGVDPRRIHIRPNGVAVGGLLPLPDRGRLRERLGIPASAPLVVALGRITAKKGLLDLAEALGGLPHVWGLVVGPDSGDGTLERLKSATRRLGLTERLALLPGGSWGPDRAQVFSDADVFCLPSATENFANAAAEAACCGLPVVVSDQCGIADWLDPQVSRVVPYGDVTALQRALSALLAPGARAATDELATRLRASLDWRFLAERQVVLYEMALGV